MAAGHLAILALIGTAGFVASAPALAVDPQTKPPANDPSKRICKEQTPTGSRFAKRVCKTAEEWQRDEDYAQTRVDENRQSLRSPDMPGAGHPQ